MLQFNNIHTWQALHDSFQPRSISTKKYYEFHNGARNNVRDTAPSITTICFDHYTPKEGVKIQSGGLYSEYPLENNKYGKNNSSCKITRILTRRQYEIDGHNKILDFIPSGIDKYMYIGKIGCEFISPLYQFNGGNIIKYVDFMIFTKQ